MSDDATGATTPLTEAQIREKMSDAMAKYMCLIAGIEPVDSTDGSCNWWIFVNEAREIYDGIKKRFPDPVSSPSGSDK